MAAFPPLPRSFTCDCHVVRDGFKCVSSSMKKMKMTTRSETHAMLSFTPLDMSQKEVLRPVWYASVTDDSIEEHHRSLETYFGKLKSEEKHVPPSDVTELQCTELEDGLMSLERYFTTLKQDTKSEECVSSISVRNTLNVTEGSAVLESEGSFPKPRYRRGKFYARRKSISSPTYDEKDSANLYLISTLLSINVAVFLFEIASPVKNSDYDLFSLPLMYGAKINDLIMDGEWWRLLTPMFLHSGVFHIGISSWMLLSFGPQVCKWYGFFTFVLIYILGGISGNVTSFLHTSEPSVGGSGPVFAVIGAWIVYQIQNKGVMTKEVSESMFQKALVATALSCLLANFGPIDTWTNVGATMSGIIYGYFTSTVLQVNDTTSDGIQETKPVHPSKSLLIFAVFLFAMSSLLLISGSPHDEMDLAELIRR